MVEHRHRAIDRAGAVGTGRDGGPAAGGRARERGAIRGAARAGAEGGHAAATADIGIIHALIRQHAVRRGRRRRREAGNSREGAGGERGRTLAGEIGAGAGRGRRHGLERGHRRGGVIAVEGLQRRRAGRGRGVLQRGIARPLHLRAEPLVARGRHVGHVVVLGRDEPIGGAARPGAGRHIADEVVPAIADPEHRGMLDVGREREGVRILRQEGRAVGESWPGREDARNLAGVLGIVHGGPGEYPEVGIEFVVDLRTVLEEEAGADRLVADIALEQDALGRMQDDPAGHGFIDRGILDEGVGRHLARLVEVEGIVAHLAALAHVHEFDALDLDLLEALAEDGIRPEGIAIGHRRAVLAIGGDLARRLEGLAGRVAGGEDADAAGQKRDRRPGLRAVLDQRGIHAGAEKSLGVGAETARDRIFRAVMGIFHRIPEGERGALELANGQLLGMAGQIVRGGDDHLVGRRLVVIGRPPAVARRLGQGQLVGIALGPRRRLGKIRGQAHPAEAAVARIGIDRRGVDGRGGSLGGRFGVRFSGNPEPGSARAGRRSSSPGRLGLGRTGRTGGRPSPA